MSIKGKKKKIIIAAAAAVLVLICAAAVYLSNGYKADVPAVEAFGADIAVNSYELDNGTVIYGPEEAETGLIFYPGGKVDHKAYEPLMAACAAEGTLCVLIEMPFDLAVFNSDGAEGIQELYPEIENWYIGGHSLGGAMAASYVSENAENYKGLILLGAYSAEDLSQTELEVLSIYGSEDRVLDVEKYEEYRSNLPEDHKEIVIEGGCHAGFGMYGEQEGDGVPAITSEEQICLTAETVTSFITEKKDRK